MLIREKIAPIGFGQHGAEELPGNVVLQQTLLILGEGRGIESRVHHVQIQEPLEQQVVLQLLAELPQALSPSAMLQTRQKSARDSSKPSPFGGADFALLSLSREYVRV